LFGFIHALRARFVLGAGLNGTREPQPKPPRQDINLQSPRRTPDPALLIVLMTLHLSHAPTARPGGSHLVLALRENPAEHSSSVLAGVGDTSSVRRRVRSRGVGLAITIERLNIRAWRRPDKPR